MQENLIFHLVEWVKNLILHNIGKNITPSWSGYEDGEVGFMSPSVRPPGLRPRAPSNLTWSLPSSETGDVEVLLLARNGRLESYGPANYLQNIV